MISRRNFFGFVAAAPVAVPAIINASSKPYFRGGYFAMPGETLNIVRPVSPPFYSHEHLRALIEKMADLQRDGFFKIQVTDDRSNVRSREIDS